MIEAQSLVKQNTWSDCSVVKICYADVHLHSKLHKKSERERQTLLVMCCVLWLIQA